jgi:hypothetical protein
MNERAPMTLLGFAIVAVGVIATVAVSGRIFILKSMQPKFDWPKIPGTTPVALALTNILPRRGMDVRILRRANLTPHDVILIRPSAARAELLARAVQSLQTERHKAGLVPDRDAIVSVEPARATLPPRVDEAEGWVDSLLRATTMWLPGIGPARFIGLHVYDSDGAEGPGQVPGPKDSDR